MRGSKQLYNYSRRVQLEIYILICIKPFIFIIHIFYSFIADDSIYHNLFLFILCLCVHVCVRSWGQEVTIMVALNDGVVKCQIRTKEWDLLHGFSIYSICIYTSTNTHIYTHTMEKKNLWYPYIPVLLDFIPWYHMLYFSTWALYT